MLELFDYTNCTFHNYLLIIVNLLDVALDKVQV